MKRYLLACIIALAMTFCTFALASWENVVPSIQRFVPYDSGGLHLLSDSVTICYNSDSLEWSADELAAKLTAGGFICFTRSVGSLSELGDARSLAPTADQILMTANLNQIELLGQILLDVSDYDVTQPAIAPASLLLRTPPLEGYGIWVKSDSILFEDPALEKLVGAIYSKTVRGILYGITSFGQALQPASAVPEEPWSLQSGTVFDYPTFARRIIGDKYDLGSGGQFADADAHGAGLLDAARRLLLDNKGNGLIQYGGVDELGNVNAQDVFKALHDGQNPDAEHNDTWQDLKMDWYQSMFPLIPDYLKNKEQKSAFVRKICSFGDVVVQSGTPRIGLIPVKEPELAPNGDFNNLLGTVFESWLGDANWSQGFEGLNSFAQTGLSQNETESISTFWHLQDTVGLPMRQMIVEFNVRVSDTTNPVEIWIESLMPPDSNGITSVPGDNMTEGDFRIFNKKYLARPNSFKTIAKSTAWETKQALFYSFGLKVDHPTFYFKNTGTGSVTVDFDSVRLRDSDTYFIHKLDSNTQKLQTEFLKLYLLDSTGTRVDSMTNTSMPRVDNLQPLACDVSYGYYHGRIRVSGSNLNISSHGIDSLQQLTNSNWRAELWYHAVCPRELPAFFDTLDPLGPFQPETSDSDTCDPYQPTFRIADNNPDALIPPILGTVQHFDSIWNNYGPATGVTGYFNRINELRFTGWSKRDLDLAAANSWTQADIYGNFNSKIIEALNDEIPGADRPMLLFGDMFNHLHNGQRITRVNNPFETGGYVRSSTNIAGADPDQPLVFVDWMTKDLRDSAKAESLITAFGDLPNPENNNWEVMFTYLPESGDSAAWVADSVVYRYIAYLADSAREADKKFTGGGLLYDSDPVFSETWDEYLDRISMLQIWWKPDPAIFSPGPLPNVVSHVDDDVEATYKAFPVPYPDDHTVKIDSAVLQYRFNGGGGWQTQKVTYQSDSLYDFSLSLPDSGGYLQYRVWAFDDLGRYGSNPPYGTKWTDPEAGESAFFTFERRKTTDIVKADTFWLPGVISKEHVVGPNGKLVFQPLPGYKHATLYVTNDAEVTATWLGTGNAKPEIVFNGTDTSYIHVKPLCDTCKWKGILDSFAIVEKNYVTFHEGTGKAMVLKDATGDAKLLVESAAYEDTVLVKGDAEISGTATLNTLIVDSGATLTILPGSELSFFEGGQLLVRDGGLLKAFGNDSTEIVFKAAVDSLPWEGIHCEVAREAEACSLEYVSVSGAVAGLLLDRGRAHVKNSTFENNGYGIMVNNGGWLVAESCSLKTNSTGLLATNLSSVELTGVVAFQNSGVGIKALSRASLCLSDCVINENDGDGLAGGIGLYTGSSAFMECTEVDANTGSGITAYGGTLMLTSVEEVGDTLTQWRGNRIEHNVTIPYEGQITLRDRVALALWNGHNSIQDTSGAGKLIHWEDQVGSDRWADTYWGSLDTAAIKSKLPSSVTLVRIDSSASSCPTFAEDNSVSDTLIQIFLDPHNNELSGYTSSAENDYKSIIRNAQNSDYAFTASDRLLNTCMLDNKDFRVLADTLEALYGGATSASLKRWLKGCRAWAFAEDEDIEKARGKLDSLAQNTPTRFDRVSARVQLQMLEIRSLDIDSTTEYKASDCIAYLDSAQKVLELMKVWTNTTISDSVVMYAPTTVEGLITISQPNGRLTILPHPGADDPTVRFVSLGAIQVDGTNYSLSRGRLYVKGEPDNRINLNWDSTSAYGNIYSINGYVNIEHANLTGTGWVNVNEDIYGGSGRTPIMYADSCTFSGFDEGLWLYGASDSCEIRNCSFESLGGGALGFTGMDGSGLSLAFSENVIIENCRFIDNDDVGIYGLYCDNVDISEVDVTGSGDYGLLAWEAANFDITCSNFHGNGDTLAEIWVEDGLVNLVGGHALISDSDGVLIYSGDASYTDIEDGENSFELTDGTGYYLKLGDTTATWDVTYNAWAPLTPADSGFFSKLYPSTPSKWTIDSSLAAFIECGGGGTSSLGGQNLIVIGEDETSGTFSTESDGLTKKSSSLSKSTATAKSGLVAKSSKVIDHHAELAKWREFKDASKSQASRQTAVAIGKQFLNEHPNSPLVPAAVVQLTSLAKRSNGKSEISSYLAQKALTTKDESVRALFTRKAYVAKAFEGNPSDALTGLEGLLETSMTKRDSICALADAIGIYAAFKSSHDLTPKHDFVKTATLTELKHRIRELSRQLDGGTLEAAESEVPVPTSYALYQNYPNPFNPTTEIRFDLPEAVRAELKVFNILGQEVVTLVDDIRNAGAYRILWDGKNAAGLSVASGVYIYQLKTPNFTNAKKMMLLR